MVCQECEKQIQNYYSKNKDINKDQDVFNIRQLVQKKYQKDGMILADYIDFSDQFIKNIHNKIRKMSSQTSEYIEK